GIFNFDDKPHSVTLTLVFDCDFVDLFEVRGVARAHRGQRTVIQPSANQLRFAYTGLDGVVRQTTIAFEPTPTALDRHVARHTVPLLPRQRASFCRVVSCADGVSPTRPKPFFAALRGTRLMHRRAMARAASVETSNQIFNEVLRRSMADLTMLITETEQG